jgi:hypothetical protein
LKPGLPIDLIIVRRQTALRKCFLFALVQEIYAGRVQVLFTMARDYFSPRAAIFVERYAAKVELIVITWERERHDIPVDL